MNNERIKSWAHVAEIVSGFAVVVTLVFLILEVRDNSDLIRANTFNRSIESLIDYRMQIASDDDSLEVMTDHWGTENAELLRRQLLVVNLWSIYEKTFFSQQYGLVGPGEWQRFDARICAYVRTEEGYEFWRANVARFLTDEFREYVLSDCEVGDKSARSPYAGEEQRSVKSLSEKEVQLLRSGAGMGFAKLAELNHYPGPKHVLAIADKLALTEQQQDETAALMQEMHAAAVALGEELIAAEQELDGKFGDATITEDSLDAALQKIGRLRAKLRYVHLKAHLRQRSLLSDEQITKYDIVRGYHGGAR